MSYILHVPVFFFHKILLCFKFLNLLLDTLEQQQTLIDASRTRLNKNGITYYNLTAQ